MFCTNCGEKLEENVTVCPNCGKEFPKAEQPVVEPIQQAETLYEEQPTVEQPKKKNGCLIAGLIVGGSAVVLGILTLVIVVIVVVAGVLFTRQKISTPSRDHVEIIEEYEEDSDYEYEDEDEDDYDYDNSLNSYSNQDYILPYSNSRYITESDLRGLTEEECRIARNEIYARHGRIFKDEELQAYFNSKSWYTPSIPADAFQEHMLNDYEKKNKDVILEYERERGWN